MSNFTKFQTQISFDGRVSNIAGQPEKFSSRRRRRKPTQAEEESNRNLVGQHPGDLRKQPVPVLLGPSDGQTGGGLGQDRVESLAEVGFERATRRQREAAAAGQFGTAATRPNVLQASELHADADANTGADTDAAADPGVP